MNRSWWTRGGVESPAAKVLIAIASVVIFGTLIKTGVIKTGRRMESPCGECAKNEVCVSGETVTDGAGRPRSIRETTPACYAKCDILRPRCDPGYQCLRVTGGGACFPTSDTFAP